MKRRYSLKKWGFLKETSYWSICLHTRTLLLYKSLRGTPGNDILRYLRYLIILIIRFNLRHKTGGMNAFLHCSLIPTISVLLILFLILLRLFTLFAIETIC